MGEKQVKKVSKSFFTIGAILISIALIIILVTSTGFIYFIDDFYIVIFMLFGIAYVALGFLIFKEKIDIESILNKKSETLLIALGILSLGITWVAKLLDSEDIISLHRDGREAMSALNVVGIIVLLSGFVFSFLIFLSDLDRQEENSKERKRLEKLEEQQMQSNYDSALRNFVDRVGAKQVICKNDLPIYITNTSIYIVKPTLDRENRLLKSEMQFENIGMFDKIGDVQYVSDISGGGGGGSSIPGAIVGGMIAGGAGAIIGSRVESEKIKTEIKEIDTRKTIIFDKNGYKYEYTGHELYFALYNYIPEKCSQGKNTLPVQQSQPAQPTIQASTPTVVSVQPQVNTSKTVMEKMNELKSLLEAGLITADDYNKKKEELLKML